MFLNFEMNNQTSLFDYHGSLASRETKEPPLDLLLPLVLFYHFFV